MTTALRDFIKNPTAAELELVARYGMQPEDARRERAFLAFAETGLPHRRMEAWKWTDFKAALKALETPAAASAKDPLSHDGALVFRVTPRGFEAPANLPDGIRMVAQPGVQAFPGAEDMPMGALAAARAAASGRRRWHLKLRLVRCHGCTSCLRARAKRALRGSSFWSGRVRH